MCDPLPGIAPALLGASIATMETRHSSIDSPLCMIESDTCPTHIATLQNAKGQALLSIIRSQQSKHCTLHRMWR